MAAGPEDHREPFSPSDFLNLPATPSDDAAPQEDNDGLVLPYISRMLMEEDIGDEYLYQHADHPALLRAAQPFADILAGAGSDSDSAAAANTNNGRSGGTLSSSDAAAALGNASWPYDPVELSQRLLCRRSYADEGQDSSTAMENTVDMEMLNQAFLKGMEEASKFLPVSSNLLVIAAGVDGTAGEQLQAEEMSSSTSTLQAAGRCRCRRKNREHTTWDGDEIMGRSRKLMMVPEEGSEVVDEFIQNGYQSLLDRMMNMSINGRNKEAEKKSRRSGSDEAVDLRTLLIHCAQSVASASGGGGAAEELLRKLKQRSSPRGDATQRLAHCFAQGLEARLAGTGSLSLMARRASAVEVLKASQLYLAVCCFHMMAFKFSNMTICQAIRNGGSKKKVHIVDYGGGPEHLHYHGFQWPTLLGTWDREGGPPPPEVRITAVGLPQPGFRPAARVDETGRRLSDFARRCGVPFRFRSVVAARWETVGTRDLDLQPDEEVVVVNSLFHFGRLMDEGVDGGVDSPSPRDMVLRGIGEMKPDVFVLCVQNSSCHAPFFVPRFREALFYYSAMFDMVDAVAPRGSDERLTLEQELIGRGAVNVIACEGSRRVERPEGYRQWHQRNERAGLRQLPLDLDVVKAITDRVKDCYHRDFLVDVDHQWLLQGWKGRILYAMSTWVRADDDA